jgi:hypothetical protein
MCRNYRNRIKNIIQVYAPTARSFGEEVEKFYNDLENALSITKNFEVTIVKGDLNAKVEEEISNWKSWPGKP